MRSRGRLFIAILFPALLAACGDANIPPGRWQGAMYDGDWIVLVRLEVRPDNVIRVSAPNLRAAFEGMTLGERIEAFNRVARELERGWPDSPLWQVDRSGNEIRRAGGYSVVFDYEPQGDRMVFHFYSNGSLTHRIPLDRVAEFAPPSPPGGL